MPKYFETVLQVPFEKSEWMSAAPQFFAGISCLLGGVALRRLGPRSPAASGWPGAVFPILGCVVAAGAMLGDPRRPTHRPPPSC